MAQGSSQEFHALVRALCEQYEKDLALASSRVKCEVDAKEAAAEIMRDSLMPSAPKQSADTEPSGSLLEHEMGELNLTTEMPPEETWADSVKEMRPKIQSLPSQKSIAPAPPASTAAEMVMAARSKKKMLKKSSTLAYAGPERLANFVRSPLFDRYSGTLLISNAVFIGFQVQNTFEENTPLSLLLIDYFFCAFFLLELFLRFWGSGCRRYWCSRKDRAWNIFDFVVVLVSTVDTLASAFTPKGEASPLGNISVLRVVRIVRIVRVLRIIRVMKFFEDLRLLIAGIIGTVKTASFAFLLICLLMYIFGIAITQLAAEHIVDMRMAGTPVPHDSEMYFYFGSLIRTVFTLFMTIAGGIDWKDAAMFCMDMGGLALFFFLAYVATMVLCVLNVLLGLFCQSAIDTAAQDRENVIQMHLQEKERFVETLETVFKGWDDSGDGKCSIEEFGRHIQDESMQALLRSLEIEVHDATTLFEMCDKDGSGTVDLGEFVTGCITLRGGAKAIHMEKVTTMNRVLNHRLDELHDGVSKAIASLEMLVRLSKQAGAQRSEYRSAFSSLPHTRSQDVKKIISDDLDCSDL
eukprot:TRINITY_DN80857_c0_g1_i1.p1 TRINITY_DN80857_c0_g1~~TRINITY_DN80857_c0_g1_i1.p1  ORF type:complete len:578 (-),score=93.60 TRINITY_DN80857_c0_g1_i1:183-1916(-)